jgi:hypothetical protein
MSFLGDLWQWSPATAPQTVGTWTQLNDGSSNAPVKRAYHAAGVHASSSSLVLFGGSTPSGAGSLRNLNDVWAYVSTSSGQSPSWCQLFGWDSSGSTVPVAPGCAIALANAIGKQPQAYYGNRNAQGDLLNAPVGKEYSAMAVVGHHMAVFGGTSSNPSDTTTPRELWMFSLMSGRWYNHPQSGSSPAARYAAAFTSILFRPPVALPGLPLPATSSPMYGNSSSAATAAAFVLQDASLDQPPAGCDGALVIHGGKAPVDSAIPLGSDGTAFSAMSDLWAFPIDSTVCEVCAAGDSSTCSCACTPQSSWVAPALGGYQFHRAFHSLSWLASAASLGAFGGYTELHTAQSIIGLVYGDTLMLPLPPLDSEDNDHSPHHLRRLDSAPSSPSWSIVRTVDQFVTEPAVRFFHSSGSASPTGSVWMIFGGRFNDVYGSVWAIDPSEALKVAAVAAKSDFVPTVDDGLNATIIQVLTGILAASALAVCVFGCVMRRMHRQPVPVGITGVPTSTLILVGPSHPAPRPGLTELQIESIPLRKWPLSSASSGEEQFQSQCPVCLEEFSTGDMVRVLPCKHCSHARCIDPWFQRSSACPLCKAEVVEPASNPLASASVSS